ncbi:MAG: hypothetical protein ABSB22_23515, partial [Thermodesulfobacteriota bacterium]
GDSAGVRTAEPGIRGVIKMETQLDRVVEESPSNPTKKSQTRTEWRDKDMKEFYMVRMEGD